MRKGEQNEIRQSPRSHTRNRPWHELSRFDGASSIQHTDAEFTFGTESNSVRPANPESALGTAAGSRCHQSPRQAIRANSLGAKLRHEWQAPASPQKTKSKHRS